MKARIWLVFLILSVVLATLLLVQRRTIKRQKQFIETLQLQIENSAGTEQNAKAELERANKTNQILREKLTGKDIELNRTRLAFKSALEMTNSLRAPSSRTAIQPNTPANPLNAFAEMMKDPEMKKAIAAQQRMALDMMYGGLFEELQLPPEQTEKLKDLLIEQQMTGMSSGFNLLNQTNSADRAELGKSIAEQQKQTNEQIKSLLGDEKYPQYQEYMSTLGERMILDQFAKQTSIGSEQKDQLLAVMKEEKESMQLNQPLTGNFDKTADWQKLMESDEFMEKQIAQQKQINENILERAGQILTPDQLAKFDAQLKNQIAMQELGTKMAKKFMTPATSGDAQK